jgi:tRNA G10  N-methylase Trm11
MDLKKLLKECFIKYFETGSFFSHWFRNHSKAYYFTFKLNLSRTNIQYGEIKSLVISNIKDKFNPRSDSKIQILTVQQLNYSIQSIVSSYQFPIFEYQNIVQYRDDPGEKGKRFRELADVADDIYNSLVSNYFEILSSTIIIDPFFNSCSIFLPPNLEIDLLKVVSLSGYINTCGELVYIRSIKKAKKEEFYSALKKSLDQTTESYIKFNVFSHEDFSHTTNSETDIEHLKIHLEKFYFDGTPLTTILYDLKKKFTHKLVVNLYYNPLKKKTISAFSYWLVRDTSIGKNIKVPGDDRYFICYKQIYKNENQLHIFNESKPAWKSNTTIPHTLIGAMINLALEDRDTNKAISIIDPFAGTGTTILELMKLKQYYNLKIYGSDIDSTYEILLRDNLEILSMSQNDLLALIKKLDIDSTKNFNDNYKRMLELKEDLHLKNEDDQEEFEIGSSKVPKFKRKKLYDRLLLYVYFIVRITDTVGIDRKNHDFKSHYKSELKKLIYRLKSLHETISFPLPGHYSRIKGFNIVTGRFSEKVIIDPTIFKEQLDAFDTNKKSIAKISDFKRLEKDKFDIIICDPPYGFNTSHQIDNLLKLYYDLPTYLVSAIKKHGQIIVSLPDESYSGKHSPWFTHREMVLTRFHFASEKLGKQIINYSEINPRKELFNAPFYWEAQRALRRSIIQLKFL